MYIDFRNFHCDYYHIHNNNIEVYNDSEYYKHIIDNVITMFKTLMSNRKIKSSNIQELNKNNNNNNIDAEKQEENGSVKTNSNITKMSIYSPKMSTRRSIISISSLNSFGSKHNTTSNIANGLNIHKKQTKSIYESDSITMSNKHNGWSYNIVSQYIDMESSLYICRLMDYKLRGIKAKIDMEEYDYIKALIGTEIVNKQLLTLYS